MEMYYIGDNDNEYGLKYGDKVELTPLEENITDGEYFGVHICNGYVGENHIGFYIAWKGLYSSLNASEVLRKDFMFWINDGVEVIGNIHDNPELLEVK